MKAQVRFAIAALGLMSAVGAAPLAFAGQAHEDQVEPAVHRGGGISRTVVIDEKTKWINVREDETIRFVVGGAGEQKNFAWKFDMSDRDVDLRQLAPKGLLGDRSIRVYVSPSQSSAQ
jgi:hypothetical protein